MLDRMKRKQRHAAGGHCGGGCTTPARPTEACGVVEAHVPRPAVKDGRGLVRVLAGVSGGEALAVRGPACERRRGCLEDDTLVSVR